MKLVYLIWLDAGSQYQRWIGADETDMRWELHSAGILVHEDDQVITFAMDCNAKGGEFRDVTSVPVSCVLEKRYFEVKEKKR